MHGLGIKRVALVLFFALGVSFAEESQPEAASPVAFPVGTLGGEDGNDEVNLAGTFFDFTCDRNGRKVPFFEDSHRQYLMDFFFNKGWRLSGLSRYYRSPIKLHTSTIMVSAINPSAVPSVFKESKAQYGWAVLFKGRLAHREPITFRFWGVGDDFLMVWVDGKMVLNACRRKGLGSSHDAFSSLWKSSSEESGKYDLGGHKAVVGDWVTLEAGVPLDMQVMVGNVIGGPFSAMLLVEVEGVEYEKNSQGGPVLPVFRTTALSRSMQDAICRGLVPGEVSVTNGPVFSVSESGQEPTRAVAETESPAPRSAAGNLDRSGTRSWTADTGQTLEARFVQLMGGKVVLEDSKGKQRKIPLERFSAEDQSYIELAHLLKLQIDFIWEKRAGSGISSSCEHLFRVEIKQTSSKKCSRRLEVEFYVIAGERAGNRHFLLDRQEGHFSPSKAYASAFSSEAVSIPTDDLYKKAREKDSFGYLVVLSDAQGQVVQHAASDEWLFENLENLRQLPVGAYMDKTCTRTRPSGLKPRNR